MAKSDKVIEIYIPSELGYEKIPMAAATTVAQRMGFSEDRIADLKTAISEAVTNAIEHGNESNMEIRVLFSQAHLLHGGGEGSCSR
jgi:serine/threonine-protein kinase RsbW